MKCFKQQMLPIFVNPGQVGTVVLEYNTTECRDHTEALVDGSLFPDMKVEQQKETFQPQISHHNGIVNSKISSKIKRLSFL